MKKILTILILLTTMLTVAAQEVQMKVHINGTITTTDVNGDSVKLSGVLLLPYDAFTSIVYDRETVKGLKNVDLGLSSGTQWANFNYGATTETEAGELLRWTEIGKVYDNWGKPFDDYWRAPNRTEIQELIDSCEWKVVMKDERDMLGYWVIGKEKCDSIFLPTTGYNTGRGIQRDYEGYYWSSDNSSSKGIYMFLEVRNEKGTIELRDSTWMMAVRPVWVKSSVKLTLKSTRK